MKNTARLVLAAIVACVAVFSTSAAAQAQNDPYPDVSVNISVPGDELIGGNTFDYEATSSDVDCDWTISYAPSDTVQTGSGTSISGTIDTPVVSQRTPTTVTAVCEYDSLASGGDQSSQFVQASFSTALAAAEPSNSAQDSATVTLLPLGGDGGGDGGSAADNSGFLPGTGGASLWILVAAVALVCVGGGAVAVSRRRS